MDGQRYRVLQVSGGVAEIKCKTTKHQGTCMAAYNLEVCYFTSCLYLSYEIKTHQLYLSPKVLQVLRQKNGSTPLEGYLILFAFKCKHCYIWLFSVIQGGSWNVSKALISFVKK